MPAARDRLDARLDDDGSRSPDDTEIAFLLFTKRVVEASRKGSRPPTPTAATSASDEQPRPSIIKRWPLSREALTLFAVGAAREVVPDPPADEAGAATRLFSSAKPGTLARKVQA